MLRGGADLEASGGGDRRSRECVMDPDNLLRLKNELLVRSSLLSCGGVIIIIVWR